MAGPLPIGPVSAYQAVGGGNPDPYPSAMMAGSSRSVTAGCAAFSHVNSTATDNFSIHLQWPAFGRFYASRIGILNKTAGIMQLTKSQAGTSAISGANANTITNWNPYLWAGVANPAFAAPPAAGTVNDVVAALNVSDWLTSVVSKDRTDNPSKKPVLQIITSASANFGASQVTSTTFADMLTATGLEFLGRIATSDIATNPGAANSTPVVTGTWICPHYVEFMYELPSSTIFDFGDSRMRGQIGGGGVGYYSAAWRLAILRNAATSSRILSPNSFAVTGQKHNASYQYAQAIIPQLRPKIVITQVHSANDPLTQAQIDQDWQETQFTQNLCNQYGAVHIVLTCPAYNQPEASDVFRRALNNRLRNSGLICADIAALVDNPAVPTQLLPSMNSGDGVHGSELYYIAQTSVLDGIVPVL